MSHLSIYCKNFIYQKNFIYAMMLEINDEKELVRILKALANPIRIRIISYLSREPMCVYDLAKALKQS